MGCRRNIRAGVSYRLVDASAIQGLHGTFGRTGIIIFDEPVIVALRLYTQRLADCSSFVPALTAEPVMASNTARMDTHILVGNDLDILNMPRRLEDLTKDIFCYTRVQSSDVERPLVRLRCRSTGEGTSATRRHHATALIAAAHRGRDCRRDGVGVLRDVKRWRRQMRSVALIVLPILIPRGSSIRQRRGWELSVLNGIGHRDGGE